MCSLGSFLQPASHLVDILAVLFDRQRYRHRHHPVVDLEVVVHQHIAGASRWAQRLGEAAVDHLRLGRERERVRVGLRCLLEDRNGDMAVHGKGEVNDKGEDPFRCQGGGAVGMQPFDVELPETAEIVE